jgi:hypothetical protein
MLWDSAIAVADESEHVYLRIIVSELRLRKQIPPELPNSAYIYGDDAALAPDLSRPCSR